MPNWCENKLEIEKGVDEFVEKYTSIDEDGHRFFRHYVALAQNKSSIKVGRKLPTFYSSV